ncbi:hypothetical protein OUZ56_018787 [Daphnia magna]|uniref:Uncharacterized protein n=1 Tax=Daphnia magna TaxID=35525 RepID=A0ABQ9Z9R7_9CRUS|nr:hypothetical protein OUZ56_018787 [Daphnia magna]
MKSGCNTPADDYIRFENYQAVPVETSPTPASSLESGTSFVGEALNFEGPIPKDHLTKEADSQGESVETARGLTSDPETEFDLRAVTSPVVPVE